MEQVAHGNFNHHLKEEKKIQNRNKSFNLLQGEVAHFLCHNVVSCKMLGIYMLLTYHKINNMPNL
jgi:hypothetical protein